MKLLLEKGADVNAQGGKYGNALQAAAFSYEGFRKMKLLLEKGADVNAQGGKHGNALQAAVSSWDSSTSKTPPVRRRIEISKVPPPRS